MGGAKEQASRPVGLDSEERASKQCIHRNSRR